MVMVAAIVMGAAIRPCPLFVKFFHVIPQLSRRHQSRGVAAT